MSKRAAIYARVSTAEQAEAGLSLDTQTDICHQHCLDRHYEVIDEVQETASATTMHRTGLQRVLDLARRELIDAIVVLSRDRVSRVSDDYMQIMLDLRYTGVTIEYVQGHIDAGNDPMLRAIDLLLQTMAEKENQAKTERVQRTMNEKVKRGQVPGAGHAPYGYAYDKDAKTLLPDIGEFAIVREIFAMATAGRSVTDIAGELTRRRIPTRKDRRGSRRNGRIGEWQTSTVHGVLTNETYMGVWHYGKTRIVRENGKRRQIPVPKAEWKQVEVEPLVDRATFDAAQEALRSRKNYNRRNMHREYLLRQMVKCSCGAICLTGVSRGC